MKSKLILIGDLDNCRLELFEVDSYANASKKQLLDMPLNEDTMVLDLGNDSVFVKYQDTTRKFERDKLPAVFEIDGDEKSEKTFAEFSTFIEWLRYIRNSCQ